MKGKLAVFIRDGLRAWVLWHRGHVKVIVPTSPDDWSTVRVTEPLSRELAEAECVRIAGHFTLFNPDVPMPFIAPFSERKAKAKQPRGRKPACVPQGAR
jgi:hypothetical protein